MNVLDVETSRPSEPATGELLCSQARLTYHSTVSGEETGERSRNVVQRRSEPRTEKTPERLH